MTKNNYFKIFLDKDQYPEYRLEQLKPFLIRHKFGCRIICIPQTWKINKKAAVEKLLMTANIKPILIIQCKGTVNPNIITKRQEHLLHQTTLKNKINPTTN